MPPLLIVLFCLTAIAGTASAGEKTDADAIFVFRVQPLLKEKCLACHGDDPKKIKSDYDMRTRETLLKGGESGEAYPAGGHPDQMSGLSVVGGTGYAAFL